MRRILVGAVLGLVFAASASAECPGRISTDAECYYVDCNSGTDHDTNCTSSSTPCRSPNKVVDTYMTDMNDVEASACSGGVCDEKYLLFTDWEFCKVTEVLSGSSYVNELEDVTTYYTTFGTHGRGSFVNLDQSGCTNCFLQPVTLNDTPANAYRAIELFQDVNGNGIDYEPRAAIYAEGDYYFHTPTVAPTDDEWETVCLSITAGTWTVEGMAIICRAPIVIHGGTGHTFKRNLVWADGNMWTLNTAGTSRGSNFGFVFIDAGGIDDMTFSYNAMTNPGHNPYGYNPEGGNKTGGISAFPLSGTIDNMVISYNYLYGGGKGMDCHDCTNLQITNNIIRHSASHGYGFDDSEGVLFANNLRGGSPNGNCYDPQLYCVNGGAANEGAAVSGTCTDTPDGTPTDRNGDGIDDEDCNGVFASDTYAHCQPNPYSFSQEICYTDSDCSGGTAEDDVFPSSNYTNAPSVLSSVHSSSTTCDISANYCLTYDVDGDDADSLNDGIQEGCGPLIDVRFDDGVADWGVSSTVCNTGTNRCYSNGSLYCSANADCYASDSSDAFRGPRMYEPDLSQDDILFIHNTTTGYGYGAFTMADTTTAMTGNGPASCSGDCSTVGINWYNEAVVDLDGRPSSSFWRIPPYWRADTWTSGTTISNWAVDYVAIGLEEASPPFTRRYNKGTSPHFYSYYRTWSWVDCTSPPCSTSYIFTTFLLDEDVPGGGTSSEFGLCCNSGAVDEDDCCPQQSCTTDFCNDLTDCDGNSTATKCWGIEAGQNDWATASGQCANCRYNENLPDYFADYYGDDLTPASGSIMHNTGSTDPDGGAAGIQKHNSAGTFTVPTIDLCGNTRDSNPDLGAIEYGAGTCNFDMLRSLPSSGTLSGTSISGVSVQ